MKANLVPACRRAAQSTSPCHLEMSTPWIGRRWAVATPSCGRASPLVGYRLEEEGAMAQEAKPKAMAARALNRAARTNVVRPEVLERLGGRRRFFIGSTVMYAGLDLIRDA